MQMMRRATANAIAFSTGDALRSRTTTVFDGLRMGGRSAMESGGFELGFAAGAVEPGAGVASLNEPDVLLLGSATTRGDDTGPADEGGAEGTPFACTFETLSKDGGGCALSGDSSAGAATGSRITGGMSVCTCAGAGTFVGPDDAYDRLDCPADSLARRERSDIGAVSTPCSAPI